MQDRDALDSNIVIESERDRRTLEYLISTCGPVQVRKALGQLSGRTRPYVSNLAKILGVIIPDHIQVTPRTEAQARISELKDRLAKRKWE
jgi:hypothetical protein